VASDQILDTIERYNDARLRGQVARHDLHARHG